MVVMLCVLNSIFDLSLLTFDSLVVGFVAASQCIALVNRDAQVTVAEHGRSLSRKRVGSSTNDVNLGNRQKIENEVCRSKERKMSGGCALRNA
ncbi:hypothetical protein KS4_23070 [Poriferisphaera corsica]|uniref:Uncharacterized protein n=1 Tax=Poriferisphaera corsica TaxID=2528020 RepID=A0A517YVN2_9BACT|nr:hypothetical protein [Poriferisphaera corsica]QDU34242.1 hypothetical protein KS4_23070 [Poriferisphaera corsica]